MNLLRIITLIGTAQGVFLAIFLFLRRYGNVPAHRFLAFFILSISLSLGGFVLYDTRYLLSYPHLTLTYNAFDFAIAPLFYLHILALTTKDFKWKTKYWWHFVPVFLVILYHLPFYCKPASEKLAWLKQSYQHNAHDLIVLSLLTTIQLFIYLLMSFHMLKIHSFTIKNYFSNIEDRDLNYIRIFLFINFFMFIVCLCVGIIGYEGINNISNFVFTGTVYWLGYRNMNQADIYKQINDPIELPELFVINKDNEQSQLKKYTKSEIPADRIEKIIRQLYDLMIVEMLYRDNELDLQILSSRLGISNHNLSQILNQHIKENFYDFVNRFRVEEFKLQLQNPEKSHYSLLAIAMECGFNSKAAFNAAFKKNTGMTPSEYRFKQEKSN